MNTEEKPRSNAPDVNAMELETLRYWNEQGIYQKSLEKNAGKEPYIFYDGPPFATGLPHYGHILASTIKDVMPRYQTMRGKYVRRRWGWDCHGLPIENIVEKKLGISGKRQIEELGVGVFNAACRDNVLTFASDWGKMVERMGRWVDFDNSYKTMDTSYQESVWWSLQQLWNKQLIYEDRKVLLYCSRCETPMSNFEIAMDNSYRDVTENSVYVMFRLLPAQRLGDAMVTEQTYVLAWTTTPWTLPGNTALNVGPDITYVVVAHEGKEYILAKDRIEILPSGYEVVREVSARSLEGLAYEPLFRLEHESPVGEASGRWDRAYRIYVEEFVTTTDGTGVVHNAAMYGEEDFQAAKRRELPRVDMLDAKGQYLPIAPEFLRGVFFKDAERPVLEDLVTRGLVFRIQPYTHSYPHCWRCGTPLFYNALPAWFINVQKMKPDMLRTAEAVEWYPAHLKDGRVKNSMSQAPDWNISRNRFWATALPFWRCQNSGCGTVDCVGSVAELRERATNFEEVYGHKGVGEGVEGVEVSADNVQRTTYNLDSLDLHKPYIDKVLLKCTVCEGQMRRTPEVVDCWVESASMPFAELHYPFEHKGSEGPEDLKNRFPADFVAEYIAQTRAWFYVMHVMGTALFDQAPFKHVVTTGTILAEDGSKMSKSKNNFPDPWVLIEKYGVDAIRFYLMQSPVMNGDDFNFSETGVKEISQKVNMLLHNVWSFYRMYSVEKLTADSLQLKASHVLDKWVLARLDALVAEVTHQLDAYNTMKACREIVAFINDLSTWYVRRSRDRIKAGGVDAEQALQTLGFVLVRICQVLAPISPFIAERIYRDVTGGESVHLSEWPLPRQGYAGQADEADKTRALEQMGLVREIVSLALAARKVSAVSVRQPLRAMAYQLRGQGLQLSVEHWNIILEELNVKQIEEYESLADAASRESGIVKQESLGPVAAVLLDTILTPELQQEGYARELERAIQDLRKKSGLRVGELVNVYYTITDPSMEIVLLERVDRKKTYVAAIVHELEVEPDNEMQLELGGIPVWLGMVKHSEG
ncbi:MAG: isoleucine--tRNA ligase [Candidatus Doudnabacteria bacterium]|nr:isoleucine--tRNA ligase [Candidatus Doudnabacteria bacterium]